MLQRGEAISSILDIQNQVFVSWILDLPFPLLNAVSVRLQLLQTVC